MALITYTDKVKMNENADVPAINKGRADDWNEVKNVVNDNYNEFVNSKPQIITLNISSASQQLTANQNYTYLNLDNIKNSTTNSTFTKKSFVPSGTSVTASGVEIPAGISKIKVSSTVQFNNNNNTSAMYFTNYIYKYKANDTTELVARAITAPISAGGDSANASCPPTLVDVEQGDVIVIRAYKSLATSSVSASVGGEARTYLTVESVK